MHSLYTTPSRPPASSQSMQNLMNLCSSVLHRKYKSDLIESGKALLPGRSQTERLAELLAEPPPLLLLQCCPSPAKINQSCVPWILSLRHTHSHTALFLPDTTAAIRTDKQRRQVWSVSRRHTTNKNKWRRARQSRADGVEVIYGSNNRCMGRKNTCVSTSP